MRMESPAPSPSASIVFETTEMERAMADMIPQMPSPPRWPAFNALRHLNRAWGLRGSDPEMMAFRCITAEEEAATALFKSLQRRKYKNAEKLKSRHHVHKNAVIPFIDAVSRVMADSTGSDAPETHIFLDQSTAPPQFEVRIKAGELADGRVVWAKSLPLHFSLTRLGTKDEDVVLDFREQMEAVASDANAKSIERYLSDRANFRNKLLYATADGYLAMSGNVEKIFAHYKRNAFMIIQLYLMIDPFEKHQLFVQQCLDGFLKILNSAPKEQIFR